MASNYTGNPLATQSPSPAPSVGSNVPGDPIGNLPADGDALNASSVLQALKVPLDWTAFFRRQLDAVFGVWLWDSTTAYWIDALVIDDDHLVYRSITGSTNKKPASNPSNWEQVALTAAEVLAVAQAANLGTTVVSTDTGIASTGGTVRSGYTLMTTHGYTTKVGRLCFTMEYTGNVADTITFSGDKVFSAIKCVTATPSGTSIELAAGISGSGTTNSITLGLTGWTTGTVLAFVTVDGLVA